MSNTGMPAYRLTADCIWNSFQSSNKRHLILTGGRGSGKTTLLGALFPHPSPGLTTWAQPGQAVYMQENCSGKTAQVGRFNPALPGAENRMVPVYAGFTALGIPALEQAGNTDCQWVTIDEIGYLESACAPYQAAIFRLMEKKHLAAVVRKQELPFLQAICQREDVFLVDLDEPFGDIGCVIMASGLGLRFGSNKLLADFGGQPLVQRILDATEGIFSQRVVVTRHKAVADLCTSRGIQTVLHDLPQRSDTVRLGLEAMNGIRQAMFCTGDQPLLRRETVISLALSARNAPDWIWRLECGGTPGSPVVFPYWAIPALRNLPPGKGGSAVIKRHPQSLHTLGIRDMNELRDIDTPSDLAALQALL